jgi:hypothetical protein
MFAAAREIRGYLYLRQSALEHHYILAAQGERADRGFGGSREGLVRSLRERTGRKQGMMGGMAYFAH